MVHVVGQAAGVIASRRAQLLQTLNRAPGALSALRGFLGQLEVATTPIRPAARAITAAAPPLATTLAQLEPFRRAADPALATATRVAPSLTRLAGGATPILRRARTAASSLATFSTHAVPPTGGILNGSIDNIIAIVADWAHAIQARDHLSHIFRGEVALSAEAIRSAAGRLALLERKHHAAGHRPPLTALTHRLVPAPAKPPKIPALKLPLPKLPLPKVTLPKLPPLSLPKTPSGKCPLSGLLDYLLGR